MKLTAENRKKLSQELEQLQKDVSNEVGINQQIGCLLLTICEDLKEIKYYLKEQNE